MSKLRLFVLGDSISMHYGPYLKAMIGDKIDYSRKGENAQVENLDIGSSINGGDSACVLAYLKELKDVDFQTDWLMINCGLHDIKTTPETGTRQIEIDAYESNLREILELVKSAGWKLIWVRTTPVDDAQHNDRDINFHRFDRDVAEYNAVADKIFGEAGVPSIDLNSFTASLDEELFCDHVHFYDPVRKLQAAYIAGCLSCIVS